MRLSTKRTSWKLPCCRRDWWDTCRHLEAAQHMPPHWAAVSVRSSLIRGVELTIISAILHSTLPLYVLKRSSAASGSQLLTVQNSHQL